MAKENFLSQERSVGGAHVMKHLAMLKASLKIVACVLQYLLLRVANSRRGSDQNQGRRMVQLKNH